MKVSPNRPNFVIRQDRAGNGQSNPPRDLVLIHGFSQCQRLPKTSGRSLTKRLDIPLLPLRGRGCLDAQLLTFNHDSKASAIDAHAPVWYTLRCLISYDYFLPMGPSPGRSANLARAFFQPVQTVYHRDPFGVNGFFCSYYPRERAAAGPSRRGSTAAEPPSRFRWRSGARPGGRVAMMIHRRPRQAEAPMYHQRRPQDGTPGRHSCSWSDPPTGSPRRTIHRGTVTL